MDRYNDWRDAFKTQPQELSLENLDTEGQVPTWLKGAFINTGPGYFEIQGSHAKHWFDGYAMLKGFYFNEGKVSFRNRILLSDNYLKNEWQNQSEKLKVQQHPQKDYILNRLNQLKQEEYSYDNANVNVFQLGDVGVSVTEVPSKVSFDIPTLNTMGHVQFQQDFNSHFELAHPTFDPVNREWINLACEFGRTTRYTIHRYDTKSRKKVAIFNYESELPFYMHSFSVTENYFILFQTPVLFDLSNADADFADLVGYQEGAPSQFILINRQNNNVKKIPVDPFVCFHQANAFDEGNQIILDLCCYQARDAYGFLYLNNLMTKPTEPPTYLTRFTLNTQTSMVTNKEFKDFCCDFPRINTLHDSGKEYSKLYLARMSKEGEWMDGLIKIDMKTEAYLIWEQAYCYCGEPIFVLNPNGDREDDGVVLSMVFDAKNENSFLLILDSKRFTTIAKAHLPTFMPFALHGDWF